MIASRRPGPSSTGSGPDSLTGVGPNHIPSGLLPPNRWAFTCERPGLTEPMLPRCSTPEAGPFEEGTGRSAGAAAPCSAAG
jgi:hypothetical protein